MEKVIINSYEEFEKLVGQQIGVSDYVQIPQERINLFADATLDHQWIHVDTERAKAESPFKSTIVHGYLTLSMLVASMQSLTNLRGVAKAEIKFAIEIEGEKKKALEGVAVFLYYFN